MKSTIPETSQTSSKRGEAVIAYGMERKAMACFQSLGIQVVTGAYGKIRGVAEAFINQALKIDENWKEKIERDKCGC